MNPRPFPLALAAIFTIVFVVLAISPVERNAWLLENVPTVILCAALLLSCRAIPLSNLSYALIFSFTVLHVLGSHYTYSLVPYDRWIEALFGTPLNEVMGWQRNHYDRLLHFLFGLLLAYPLREIFFLIANAKGFWGYYLPLNVIMASSLIYELIEWAAAVAFGGDLGTAYLGTQGDSWDAQWDMALATLGALLAIALILVINLFHKRDFHREWSESISNPPFGD
jgi:putative membrane protein